MQHELFNYTALAHSLLRRNMRYVLVFVPWCFMWVKLFIHFNGTNNLFYTHGNIVEQQVGRKAILFILLFHRCTPFRTSESDIYTKIESENWIKPDSMIVRQGILFRLCNVNLLQHRRVRCRP